MRRLLLAGLAGLCAAAPLRAQGQKDTLLDAVLSFRTARQSNITRDLLEDAMAEVARQQSLAPAGAGAVADVEPEEADVAVEARRTFAKLVAAFSGRRRSAFNRYVSSSYRVDPAVLDDDLALTFRTYPIIRLTADIDKVDVEGDVALVQFHYNLVRDSNAGAETKFSGRTRLRFRLEGGKAMLIQQDAPQLFGTTLPTSEHPRAVSQGPSPDSGSTGPSCTQTLNGAATTTDGVSGFRFRTLSLISPFDKGDFFKVAGATALRTFTSRLKSLGVGPLSDIHDVTPGGFTTVVPFVVGERFAVRTPENKLALIRIESLGTDGFGTVIMNFKYEFQTDGTKCF